MKQRTGVIDKTTGCLRRAGVLDRNAHCLHLGADPLALAYIQANSITDPVAKACINNTLSYLRANLLLPDDACFLRLSQQSGSTSLKSLAGLTGVSLASAALGANGLICDTGYKGAYWDLAIPVGAFTLMTDVRGKVSGQTAYATLAGMFTKTTGTAAQVLCYADVRSVHAFCKQGATAVVTDGTVNPPFLSGFTSGYPTVSFITYDHAASPTVICGFDALVEKSDSTGNPKCTDVLDRLVVGLMYNGGTSYNYQFRGTIGSWFLYSRVLSQAERAIVTRAMRLLDPRRISLVAWGDSLSAIIDNPTTRAPEAWARHFAGDTSFESKVRVTPVAVSSQTSAWGVTNYPTYVRPFKPDGKMYSSGWMTLLFGTNDILNNGRTAQQVYDSLQEIIALAKGDGFKVCLMTVPPGKNSAYAAPLETIRLALNVMLRASTTQDALVDLETINAISEAVPAFWYDDVHFSDAGYKLIAERIAMAITMDGVTVPQCTVRPVLTGTAASGSTLTCDAGTWLNAPQFSPSYQWYRNATPISGTTPNTLLLSAPDVGNRIFCRVTATNLASETQTASSDLTAIVV